jgi:uncharacterized membrane protein YedE/YeeE
MDNFTPVQSLLGGMLIGLASAKLLLFNGRIAGISGILGGLVPPARGDSLWRVLFVGGLVVAGVGYAVVSPAAFRIDIERSMAAVVAAGLLVGFGTRMGSGCTSGHGVCGISRFSRRSLLATGTFMLTGAITVFVINHLLGGSL